VRDAFGLRSCDDSIRSKLPTALPSRPLLNDDPQIIQLLDRRLHIASSLWPVLGNYAGHFGESDHAAVAPCALRQCDNRLRKVARPDLDLLPSRSLGSQHRALANIAWIRVCLNDPEVYRIRSYSQKWIRPRRGIVNIHIEALCRQRNAGQCLALLIADRSARLRGCLGLLLGIHGVFGDTDDSLLLFVAGNKTDRE